MHRTSPATMSGLHIACPFRRASRSVFVVLAVLMGSSCLRADDSGPPWYPDKYNLLVYSDQHGVQRPVKTAADWAVRRSHILASVQLVTGPLPSRENLPPLGVQITEEVDQGGYIQRKLTYVSEADGERVPAYLLIPKQLQTPNPAMLCLHQTAHGGKAEPVGLTLPPYGYPDLYYAKHLTERGYITLSPDYPGFGEYPLEPNARNVYERGYVSVTMKGVWNHMRGVDLLLSMPEVDAARVGVIGHSLGAFNALLLAAFDDRIQACVASCGFTRFETDKEPYRWASDDGVLLLPNLKSMIQAGPSTFDWEHVLALAAPSPTLVITALTDALYANPKSCQKAVTLAKRVYKLLGAANALDHFAHHDGHRITPETLEVADEWFERWL